jgi:3-methyladenine DNA glycosylase/8-oxoguanine DNA glycosylase
MILEKEKATETFLRVRDYDLAATLDSGQVFRWRQNGDSWEGVVGKHFVRLTQTHDGIRAETAAPVANWQWLRDFLQTETDLAAVLKTFPDEEPMRRAVIACRGLRVLRQEPWECLASFILSSTKQIVQIRQIIALLCERFGEPVALAPFMGGTGLWPVVSGVPPETVGGRGLDLVPVDNQQRTTSDEIRRDAGFDGRDARATHFKEKNSLCFAFPPPQRITAATENELRACKMGFRAPHLLATARQVAEGKLDLEKIRSLPLAEARAELMQLRGVGGKIADCVLLFAYGFDSAFPVDVWVERALRQLYFPRRRVTEKNLRHFAATHFGPHAGYAQQYLFHYMRTKMK